LIQTKHHFRVLPTDPEWDLDQYSCIIVNKWVIFEKTVCKKVKQVSCLLDLPPPPNFTWVGVTVTTINYGTFDSFLKHSQLGQLSLTGRPPIYVTRVCHNFFVCNTAHYQHNKCCGIFNKQKLDVWSKQNH
jgi:hypothetical protein